MKHWLFHPLIFYPLAILIAGLVIVVSLRPQAWPREPTPVAAQVSDGMLIYTGNGFDAPSPSPDQHMTVTRDFWGNPQSLRIAVLPRQPFPTPAEQGVRIMLRPQDAALIENKPVTIEISYNALQVNGSWGLAASLQGIGPAEWVAQPTPPDATVVRIELPAQFAVNAIGLRAIQNEADQAFGIEITRIRIIPRA
jgi:hypothetical protein